MSQPKICLEWQWLRTWAMSASEWRDAVAMAACCCHQPGRAALLPGSRLGAFLTATTAFEQRIGKQVFAVVGEEGVDRAVEDKVAAVGRGVEQLDVGGVAGSCMREFSPYVVTTPKLSPDCSAAS